MLFNKKKRHLEACMLRHESLIPLQVPIAPTPTPAPAASPPPPPPTGLGDPMEAAEVTPAAEPPVLMVEDCVAETAGEGPGVCWPGEWFLRHGGGTGGRVRTAGMRWGGGQWICGGWCLVAFLRTLFM